MDERLKEIVYIDGIQFGFMKGKGTTDAMYRESDPKEHVRTKQHLHCAFLDLENAFDRVPM